MKTLLQALFILPLFLLTQSSCAQVEVTRSLADFTAIDSKGSVDVFLTQGDETSVRLKFRNISEHEIVTEVDGNTLRIYIDADQRIFQNHDVKAYVTFKQLDAIYSSGSGDVECHSELEGNTIKISTSGSGDIRMKRQIAGDRIEIQTKGSGELDMSSAVADEMWLSTHGSGDLTVNGTLGADELSLTTNGSGNIRAKDVRVDYLETSIAGSGDITVSNGSCDQAEVNVRGSGDLIANHLMTQQANIEIAGSGDVTFGVEQELAVSIRGSGDVRYKGNGKISNVNIKGSGSINKI